MSTTETQGQKTNQEKAAAGDKAGGQTGGSRPKKALKVGALAAAAGTAAFAASKAVSSRGEKSESSGSSGGSGSEDGASRGRTSRVSMDQVVSAMGSARWDVLKDLLLPLAESGARSAGAFVANEGPDFVNESLVPKFIDGFKEAQGSKS